MGCGGIAFRFFRDYNKREEERESMQKAAHILICDDQPIIHDTLGAYLDNEGFTHASAFNGVQAVQMFEKESPDLILMDLMILVVQLAMLRESCWHRLGNFLNLTGIVIILLDLLLVLLRRLILPDLSRRRITECGTGRGQHVTQTVLLPQNLSDVASLNFTWFNGELLN